MTWTILIITILSGPVEGGQSFILYPSMQACDEARRPVSDTFQGAYDYKLECRETNIVRASLRPRKRP